MSFEKEHGISDKKKKIAGKMKLKPYSKSDYKRDNPIPRDMKSTKMARKFLDY